MIRRFKKHEADPQLDLFAPRSKSALAPTLVGKTAAPEPADPRRLHLSPAGWYLLGERLEGPVSRATGGALNAVEAWRAQCGYSIELVGMLSESGVYCDRCVRFIHYNPHSKPLYEPARGDRRLRGEDFTCSRCSTKFTAHRYERA